MTMQEVVRPGTFSFGVACGLPHGTVCAMIRMHPGIWDHRPTVRPTGEAHGKRNTMTTTRSRIGSVAFFVGDDSHISAAADPNSPFSTDLYIRDVEINPLVTLHLSPDAVRELRDTCDRAIKSIEFEEAKRDAAEVAA